MPAGQNPYYNPMWADAARNIATALTGDPEQMGRVAYEKARLRETTLKGDRQEMENQALQGLADALSATGTDPAAAAAAMPNILGTMARAGLSDPSKFLTPQWAITGESLSGASPDEAFVRAGYAAQGKDIPLDLALTPQRADNIRAQEYAADESRAMAVQGANKPLKTADVEGVLLNALSGIPGVVERDDSQYKKPYMSEDAGDYFASQGLMEPMRNLVVETLRATGGDQEAARAAVMRAMNMPQGVSFKNDFGARDTWMPFDAQAGAPALVGADGQAVNINAIVDALSAAMSQGDPAQIATPPDMPPDARQAKDGNFYVPDPSRPGKYLMVR